MLPRGALSEGLEAGRLRVSTISDPSETQGGWEPVSESSAPGSSVLECMMDTRNYELAVVLKNDCRRLCIRTVGAKKGRGRKDRPRNSNRSRKERVQGAP